MAGWGHERLRISITLGVSLVLHVVLLAAARDIPAVAPTPATPPRDPRLVTLTLAAPPAVPRRVAVAGGVPTRGGRPTGPATRAIPLTVMGAATGAFGYALATTAATAPVPTTSATATAVSMRPGAMMVDGVPVEHTAPVLAAPAPAAAPAPPRTTSCTEPRAEVVQATGSTLTLPARLTPRRVVTDAVPETVAAPPGETRPARVAARTEPVYPSGARDDGREGTAELRVALDADGRITSVAVSRSAGDARLDRAAADAVRHWRFDPALTDGRATAATLRVNVHFRLY